MRKAVLHRLYDVEFDVELMIPKPLDAQVECGSGADGRYAKAIANFSALDHRELDPMIEVQT